MKVLIAEDDSILLKTIELKLKKEGYEVITTRDGREAIEKIDISGADLVITDIMMPFASGLEIVARLRTSNQSKRIPIIMLTSLEQEKTVMEAFALGADDYMTKPFSLNELAARVKKLFRPPSPAAAF
ncbi:response regulator transcription factor [Sediminibacterium roseum]|uniref:Response regulator transcription factor n=1 Tax=Sediminibacterium roseum TaxID=1978412 RepID=A0ABW9ZXS6_9BACT|nr:response regulator transcription factor [Sediminibacterium roseum]NCI49973.1 response regulator transcription factor [Sediminibacterium roseum]